MSLLVIISCQLYYGPLLGHNNTKQVYSETLMTHVMAMAAGQSSQGTSEPITPGIIKILII